jgi:hypothetical protein
MKKRSAELTDADWVHEKFDSIDIEQKREFRKWLKATAEGSAGCLVVQESWLELFLVQEHEKLH